MKHFKHSIKHSKFCPYLLVFLMTIMTSQKLFAGSPESLCNAVHASEYIVEVTMDGTQGQYSEAEIKKDWAPKQTEKQKILASAQVSAVLKGTYTIGQILNDPTLILPASHVNSQFWNALFHNQKITMLTGPALQEWIADGGDSSVPNTPYMHQNEYSVFKAAVLACLAN